MKILITGVAGLCARLADYVVDTIPHVTVVGVDNLSGGFAEKRGQQGHLSPNGSRRRRLEHYLETTNLIMYSFRGTLRKVCRHLLGPSIITII